MKVCLLLVLLSSSLSFAQTDYGYLKKSDQQYYKNDSFEGKNKQERIDDAVKEINKMHAEMNQMKSDIAELKAQVELLKASAAADKK